MLVSFHKGFILEGEASFKSKKYFWSKPELKRQKIYLNTGVWGICDDSELEAEIDRLTQARLNSDGWGDKFHGWQKVLTYEESLEVSERECWDPDYYIPTTEVIIKTLDIWTVEKAAKELTGKQFAQYCKDYGIILNTNDTIY